MTQMAVVRTTFSPLHTEGSKYNFLGSGIRTRRGGGEHCVRNFSEETCWTTIAWEIKEIG
jgi:hypothetical protein